MQMYTAQCLERTYCQVRLQGEMVREEHRHERVVMPSVQGLCCAAYPPLTPGALVQSFLYLPLPLSTLPAPLSHVATGSALRQETVLTVPSSTQDSPCMTAALAHL
jgi:hypothetical protein